MLHGNAGYRVLEKSYTHGAQNSGNMIIHGDNLDALKALLPKYEGRVKCIYIDIVLQNLIQFNGCLDILPLAG